MSNISDINILNKIYGYKSIDLIQYLKQNYNIEDLYISKYNIKAKNEYAKIGIFPDNDNDIQMLYNI